MTYLQLVNAVLIRLRETEASSVSESSYSQLIGAFINEAKREVEDAWDWVQLRDTIQVTTVIGTFRYVLTGAGNRSRILQAINDTEDTVMKVAPYKWMNKQFTASGSGPSTGSPLYYDINGNSDGDPQVDVYPVPAAIEVLNFNMVLPQSDLSSDDTALVVPSYPVILGGYMKALSERGEDGGNQFGEALSNYTKALSDAIAIDANTVQDELMWEVV